MQMLEYDPDKRITAQQALTHEFFRGEPAPGSLSNGSEWDAEPLVHVEKEPSASHAEPAEAAVLPKAGKPGSSQVTDFHIHTMSFASIHTMQISYIGQSSTSLFRECSEKSQGVP